MPASLPELARPVTLLRCATASQWAPLCLQHMDVVLRDHAHCEKKAAASALSLLSSYPQHDLLVQRAAALAAEELRHFRQVLRLLRARNVRLGSDGGDPYVQALRRTMRSGQDHHFLDRLLVSSLIEARSCERLGLLGTALRTAAEPDLCGLADFYDGLARCEAGHAQLFVRLACAYLEEPRVLARLQTLAEQEAAIVGELPLVPRIH